MKERSFFLKNEGGGAFRLDHSFNENVFCVSCFLILTLTFSLFSQSPLVLYYFPFSLSSVSFFLCVSSPTVLSSVIASMWAVSQLSGSCLTVVYDCGHDGWSVCNPLGHFCCSIVSKHPHSIFASGQWRAMGTLLTHKCTACTNHQHHW